MEAGKRFQPVQPTGLLERLGVQLQRRVRGVQPRASAGRFLRLARMRRAVRTEEEMRVAAGGRLQQRGTVRLALEDGRAVVVRADAALEQRVAVEQQVVRRDRGCHVGRCVTHEVHRVAGGDVFQHHAQLWEPFAQRQQVALDEHALAIEDVDGRIGHLAMQQQRQFVALHRLDHRMHPRQLAHAGLRVGGGAGGVILHRKHAVAVLRAGDLVDRGVLGEIQRHQRLESRPLRQAGQNPPAIVFGLRHRGHRRLQVRHHDGAREALRGVADHRSQRVAIAKMQVPVVGAGDFQARGGHGLQARACGGRWPWYRGGILRACASWVPQEQRLLSVFAGRSSCSAQRPPIQRYAERLIQPRCTSQSNPTGLDRANTRRQT